MTDHQEYTSPAEGAPGPAGLGQPHNQPNAMPPAGWGSNPGYGAWPAPGGEPPAQWFGPQWEAAMVQSAHRSIKNLLIGLVVFLLAIGFIIFAAVANNFDQVKGLLGVSPTSSAVAGSMTSLAAAGSPTSLAGAPSPTTTTKTAADINVGDCLADDPSGNVSDVNIVSCASPHAAEVVAVLTMPDGPFPNQSTIDDYKNKCADALNAYSSTSSQDPSIQLTTLTPLSDDWSDGDHTMDCVASLSPPRTASIKG